MTVASLPMPRRMSRWPTPRSASTSSDTARKHRAGAAGAPAMLKLIGLDVAIGTVQVLRSISLDVPTGVMAGLIGRNGAGKTTLMRSIMGLLAPAAGGIEFDGNNLLAMPTHSRTSFG